MFDAAFFVAVFAFRAGVVDGDPGVGIGVGGDIGDGTFAGAAHPRPVRDGLLPGGRGEHHAAAAAGGAIAVPHGLARPRAARAKAQAGAAHRNHVRRGGGEADFAPFRAVFRIPVQIAIVAGSRRDHDAGMVERAGALQGGSLALLGARPRVRDLPGAEVGSAALSRFEVFIARPVGLHEHDVAALAGGVRDLDVERDLDRPPGRFRGLFAFRPRAFARRFQFFGRLWERQAPGFAVLVDLPEAAIGGRASGQSKFFVVRFQIRFGGGIVVGVDQRHRLCAGRASRQRIGDMQILWPQAKGARVRRGRGQRGTAGHPERVPAGASFGAPRHELHRQAPGMPTSGCATHRADGVIRAGQRRDGARGRALRAAQP